MPLVVRAAGEHEAAEILRLTKEAFAAHRDLLDPPSSVHRERVEDVMRAMLEGTVYIADRDGNLVGAARVHALQEPQALYCGRLAVLPVAWGGGIGSALMEAVEQGARDAGYPAVVVGVRLQLPQNLRFFQRRGYSIYAEHSHPGYERPTYVRLRKDL
jgi:predicted N-acetyltransferase YhbS